MRNRLDDYFFSPQVLRSSFRRFHEHKRGQACHPSYRAHAELVGLIQNHESLTAAAMRAIKAGQYRLECAQKETICVDKRRVIHNFNWLDTFMLYHLACAIELASAPLLPTCLYSYRKGFSAGRAVSRAAEYIRSRDAACFVVRRDVQSFGEQMRHHEILKDLERFIHAGPLLLAFAADICAFRFMDHGKLGSNSLGLPGGHYLQLVCENLYLLDLDRAMQALPGCYMRFGDDILYLCNEAAEACGGARIIEEYVGARGLALNPAKGLDLSLEKTIKPDLQPDGGRQTFKPVSQVLYLGACLDSRGNISVPAKKIRPFRAYMRRRIQAACRALPSHADSRMRLNIALRAASRLLTVPDQGSPVAALLREPLSEQQLRELDTWLALVTQKLAYRRGFNKGNFKRCQFRFLRKMGLPSLRHLRRTMLYA